eukprot:3854782-Ditylum_brightwellii.AAC.1
MAQKLKDLKMPCKRPSSSRKKMASPVVVVEESNRKLRQLKRERLKNPIRLSRKTRTVRVVFSRHQDMLIDMMQHVGQKDTFEKNMRDRLKKYKKAFRELTMRQRQKRINEMAMEVMCCCLVKEDVGKYRVEQDSGVKMNMMIHQDTEARDDDAEGLISELDENTKKEVFGIWNEAMGCDYERIRKN